jgi:hypothetical protein
VKRALLGWSLCALALVAGVLSATLAAGNRARADELDRLERWCEAQARKNELARVANQRQEGLLLYGTGSTAASARDGTAEDPR